MMSHGVADKSYLFRLDPKGGLEINKYRTVCVPGDWLKKRILSDPKLELEDSQIKVVGWPRIDSLLAEQRNLNLIDKFRRYLHKRKIKVLWAPTHDGGQKTGSPVSSFPSFLRYKETLQQLFDFSVSLHPAQRNGGMPTFQSLLDADVVISDRGTMVYEAWALNKPVIFPSWIIGDGNREKNTGSAESFIFRKKIGFHAQSFDEMIDLIRIVKKPDSQVLRFMDEYLPARTRGNSNLLLAEAVKEIWNSGDLGVKRKVVAEDD